MIRSMTGFGRGEFSDDKYSFLVEMKTLNHRYNDIIVKIPKHISFLEDKVKKRVKDQINRGRVEVYINLEYLDQSDIDIKTNVPLAKSYFEAIEIINKELGIEDKVTLNHILANEEVIKFEKKELNEERVWFCLEKAMEKALNETIDMRKEEGIELSKDIQSNLLVVEGKLKEIEKRSPLVVDEYKVKLKGRVEKLLDEEYELDEEKLENEIVFFADKCDINEEVIRLHSHINQFRDSLNEDVPVGRKLDFLVQEMNREINTIGSKASDLEISKNVVEIKSEIEKIREQIQNVE